MSKLRYDFHAIAEWIGEGETVLDLGCGDGSLLRHLADTRGVLGYGVEADPENVKASIRNGINVRFIVVDDANAIVPAIQAHAAATSGEVADSTITAKF